MGLLYTSAEDWVKMPPNDALEHIQTIYYMYTYTMKSSHVFTRILHVM